MSIGVLISSHARPATLRPQLAAIDAQTVKPDEIVIFHDHAPGVQPDTEAMRGRRVIATNWQSGVWQRFAFCLWGFKTDYVCIFDDDTVPAPGFFEHVLASMQRRPALYGVNGVIFPNGQRGPPRRYIVGWEQRDAETDVDIVGHAWVFERVPFGQALACVPKLDEIDTAGEDYAMAFAAQKLGVPVLVPSVLNESVLGSTQPKLGTDDKALYRQPGEEEKKARVHDFYLKQGWKPLAIRNARDIFTLTDAG